MIFFNYRSEIRVYQIYLNKMKTLWHFADMNLPLEIFVQQIESIHCLLVKTIDWLFQFINRSPLLGTSTNIFLRQSRKTLGCGSFLLKFSHFSPESKETWSLCAKESKVWIGNLNVKTWKTTEHILQKIWRSLKLCKTRMHCSPLQWLSLLPRTPPAMHAPCHAYPCHAHPLATHAPRYARPLPCIAPAMYTPLPRTPPAMHTPHHGHPAATPAPLLREQNHRRLWKHYLATIADGKNQ